MIQVSLENAGKRFNRDWIFRDLSQTFSTGEAWLVSGSNGSGKSTLLKTLLGYAPLSEGTLRCKVNDREVPLQLMYRHFSISAPYLELYEELTLDEAAAFHFKLKPPLVHVSMENFATLLELEHARHKPIKFFSSGMKQRVRLGLAILAGTEAVLLDEPTSNLDRNAVQWYRNLISEFRGSRLFVVSSNQQPDEYFFCESELRVEDFKPISR